MMPCGGRVTGKVRRSVIPQTKTVAVPSWTTSLTTIAGTDGDADEQPEFTNWPAKTMYCQKCRTPLRLDPSLENLNPTSFDLLVGRHHSLSFLLQLLIFAGSYEKAHKTGSSLIKASHPSHSRELYDQVSKQPHSPTHKRVIPPPRQDDGTHQPQTTTQGHAGNPDMSFIEVTESQIVPHTDIQREAQQPQHNSTVTQKQEAEPTLSWQANRTDRLFSILSSHSDIDHPICSECTSMLLAAFSARLSAASKERDAYVSFLKSIQASENAKASSEEIKNSENEFVEMLEQEKIALRELESAEEEKRALEEDLHDLEQESKALALEEKAFWASRNRFEEELHDLTTDLASLQDKYAHDEQQLERLQRTNVFNDTFCIGHDGYFVTINALRLGRLPNRHVEWAEINAALGQAVLLLATVAERLGFEFKGYQLKPLGSASRIEKVEWLQQAPPSSATSAGNTGPRQLPSKPTPKISPLDLFSGGDTAVGRMFSHRRFDAGMVAFLDCLAQIGAHVEKLSATSEAGAPTPQGRNSSARKVPGDSILPYPINGDKIGDPDRNQAVSIKLGVGFQQDESWTKALKYAMTYLKFIQAFVSNMSSVGDGR